jgi:hypothetical protein
MTIFITSNREIIANTPTQCAGCELLAHKPDCKRQNNQVFTKCQYGSCCGFRCECGAWAWALPTRIAILAT